jgi:hypothetical protein
MIDKVETQVAVVTSDNILPQEFRGSGVIDVGGVFVQQELAEAQNYQKVIWDKKAGVWLHSTYTDESQNELTFQLRGLLFTLAIWSDKVGEPKCFHLGAVEPDEPCYGFDHERGIRVYFEDSIWGESVTDFFGITYRVGQAVVKQAMAGQQMVKLLSRKEINTKYGRFFIPGVLRNSKPVDGHINE